MPQSGSRMSMVGIIMEYQNHPAFWIVINADKTIKDSYKN